MFLYAFERLKGKNDEAREMGQEALQIFRKTLGDDHPNTKIAERAWVSRGQRWTRGTNRAQTNDRYPL